MLLLLGTPTAKPSATRYGVGGYTLRNPVAHVKSVMGDARAHAKSIISKAVAQAKSIIRKAAACSKGGPQPCVRANVGRDADAASTTMPTMHVAKKGETVSPVWPTNRFKDKTAAMPGSSVADGHPVGFADAGPEPGTDHRSGVSYGGYGLNGYCLHSYGL